MTTVRHVSIVRDLRVASATTIAAALMSALSVSAARTMK
jgi:hypothetical protein